LGNTVNLALWIVQGLLALVYLAAGGLKTVRPREQLVASGNRRGLTLFELLTVTLFRG
jgi:hypothetical protein